MANPEALPLEAPFIFDAAYTFFVAVNELLLQGVALQDGAGISRMAPKWRAWSVEAFCCDAFVMDQCRLIVKSLSHDKVYFSVRPTASCTATATACHVSRKVGFGAIARTLFLDGSFATVMSLSGGCTSIVSARGVSRRTTFTTSSEKTTLHLISWQEPGMYASTRPPWRISSPILYSDLSCRETRWRSGVDRARVLRQGASHCEPLAYKQVMPPLAVQHERAWACFPAGETP